jgi:hypothetical protein
MLKIARKLPQKKFEQKSFKFLKTFRPQMLVFSQQSAVNPVGKLARELHSFCVKVFCSKRVRYTPNQLCEMGACSECLRLNGDWWKFVKFVD